MREAAQAIGCSVALIVKSIALKGTKSGRAVLVAASGVNRIKEGTIALSLNESVEKTSPKFVREATGFALGGVAAGGHGQCLREYHRSVGRVAAVSDSAFLSIAPRIASHFVSADVRHFAF